MEPLDSRSSRIDGEYIVFGIVDNLEYVRVAADEYVWHMGIYKLECLEVISPRVSPYMHHENPHPLHLKELHIRMG